MDYEGMKSDSKWKPRKHLVRKNATREADPEPRLSSPDGMKRKWSGDDDSIVEEMWQVVAGDGDSRDADDNFIDDARLDSGRQSSQAKQRVEEDDEIEQLFKVGRKKKKQEKSAAEISILVENVMAELEVVAEEDAELNRQSKPAINKLQKLPFLQHVLSKKPLQAEFLDHGILSLFKTWLEPLPDGSLPNITLQEALFKLLHDLPIDLERFERREQLKRSGLGKVIKFFSRTGEVTASNRKLAKELVDKWSRPIFNNSIRFEDTRGYYEDERVPMRRRPLAIQQRDDDLNIAEVHGKDLVKSSSRMLTTTRPEAMLMDFVVRPRSKINPDAIRARAAQAVKDQRRARVQKNLKRLKTAPKRRQIQATKLSAKGMA